MLREDFEEFLSLKKPEVEEDVLCCLLILNKFFELVLFEVGPVSYTHLDVYKRQI